MPENLVELAGSTPPVSGPLATGIGKLPVREVLGVVIEELWHRQFAERDLDALAARAAVQP